MRRQYEVWGACYDDKTRTMKPARMVIRITADHIGTTVSIQNVEEEKQFTVPFDLVIRDLKKEQKI